MIKQQLAKIIRVVTIPPVMALLLIIVLFFTRGDFFGSPLNLALAILFLVVLPILGYPLQPLIPYSRDRGRDGQRSLAMWMASAGYVLGVITAVLLPVSDYLLIIYLTYLLSGLSLVPQQGIQDQSQWARLRRSRSDFLADLLYRSVAPVRRADTGRRILGQPAHETSQ